LLEGDEPSFLTEAGSAEKFALGPSAPPDHFDEGNAHLPASYGTGRMFLTARDPHWLYAHWDFSAEEQFRHNARSVDRHLIIRLHSETDPAQRVSEIHVHPESKYWFVHVEQAGQTYFTELGYYQTGRRWKTLATSTPQRTPPGNISRDSTVTFATIPLELSFETMLAMLRETADEDMQAIPLARAIENIRTTAGNLFPDGEEFTEWTPEQTEELESIFASARANVPLPNSDDSARENLAGEESITSGLEMFSSYCASFF
jgi:hypothetical protein